MAWISLATEARLTFNGVAEMKAPLPYGKRRRKITNFAPKWFVKNELMHLLNHESSMFVLVQIPNNKNQNPGFFPKYDWYHVAGIHFFNAFLKFFQLFTLRCWLNPVPTIPVDPEGVLRNSPSQEWWSPTKKDGFTELMMNFEDTKKWLEKQTSPASKRTLNKGLGFTKFPWVFGLTSKF